MKNIVLYILLLVSTLGFSQSELIKAEIDTTNIRIGEQFQYKITVDETENVIIPKLDKMKGLEVVSEDKIDTIKNSLIKKYILTGFDSGAYYIPQQQIFIKNQAYLTDSLLINVATVAIDTTKIKKFPIKGIKGEPYQIDDFKQYLWWLLGILLLIGLLLYLFVFRKKKVEEEKVIVPALAPYEEALQKLHQLDEKLLWQNNKVKQYYSELTEILRNYIGRDVEIPTLELTSNEIVDLVRVQNDSKKLGLPKETINNISKLLRNADMVKFAKSKPMSNEIEFDRKTAEQIINNIQPKVKEYKEVLLASNPETNEKTIVQEGFSTKTDFKKQKKNSSSTKKNKALIGFIIGFLILIPVGFFVGSKISNFLSKNFDTTTTKELAVGNWKSYTIGNPSITLQSPVEIPKEEIDDVIPDEVKKYINSMDGYNYQSFVNNLQIAFASSVYLPEINADINGAVNGAIAKIQQQPNVTDFKYKVEPYDKFNAQSALLKGTFKENTISKALTSIVITQKNTIRIIILSHKEGDENGKEICNKIINSITIENVE